MKRFLSLVLCKIILRVLYRALKVLSALDTRVREDFLAFKDGFRVRVNLSLKGEGMTLEKRDGRLVVGKGRDADVTITFKSIPVSLRVFTGLKGIATAYSEHRFTLSGSIADTMALVRMIEIAESYLFPHFMTRRIMRDIPAKQTGSLRVYRKVLLGV